MNRTSRSNYSQLVLERPTFFHSEKKMCVCHTVTIALSATVAEELQR